MRREPVRTPSAIVLTPPSWQPRPPVTSWPLSRLVSPWDNRQLPPSPTGAAPGADVVKIFPWRSRSQRRAAVTAAQEGAAQARERADESELLKADLRRMAADNHFAKAIHDAITGKTATS